MRQIHLFRVLFCALLVSAFAGLAGCSDNDDDQIDLPTLEVKPATITFDEKGGTKTFDIITTGRWAITGAENADWIAITPAFVGKAERQITVTAGQSAESHSVTLKVKVYTDIYGVEKEVASKDVVITQTPGGEQPSDEVIYGNNFDKELATQTFGPSGNSWPFLDQFDGWQNQTGTGASTVTYAYKSMSVRTSGKLSGGYEGASAKNKLFFGAAPAEITVENITLPSGKTNYRLTFGASFYDGSTQDNIFKTESFRIMLGNGTAWSDAVTYEKIGGSDAADPFWTLFAVNFTLSAPVEKLAVKFTADLASVFAMDDVTLTEGLGGQTIDFGGGGTPGTREVTIPELIGLMTSTQTVLDAQNDCIFEAVVVTDKAGGNYNKNNLQLMTAGATEQKNGLTLYGSGKYTNPEDAVFALAAGDKVKVTLKAGLAQIVNYQGLYEVTGAVNTDWVVVEKSGTTALSPITIGVDDLAAYQAMPVAVANATSPATAAAWCTADAFGLHTFTVDGKSLPVFVQANMPGLVGTEFKASTTGTVIGYATVYQNTAQICPQYPDDVQPFLSNAPVISNLDPSSLIFDAAGATKSVTITTANADGYTLSASATSPFTATLNGDVASVTAPANTTSDPVNGTLTITLTKEGTIADTKTVTLTQAGLGASVGFESIAAFRVAAYADNSSADAYYSLSDAGGTTSTVNTMDATGIKFGTGSKAGVYTSPALGVTGDKTLVLYGVAWKDKAATLYVRVNGGGSVSGAASATLAANVGATGNPPFTITVTDADKYLFSLTGLTATSTVTLSTNAEFTAAADASTGRAVLCGIQLD